MKRLSWFDKIMFFLNSLFAAGLLLSYLLPFIPPNTFALVSVLSLGVPLLIIVNFLFFLYWLIKFRRQMLLSLIVLLLGFNHLTSFYEFSTTASDEGERQDISILSYNVRQFNKFGWSPQDDIPEKIGDYIKQEDPDIIGMQEYYKGELAVAETFPHKYINKKSESADFGLALFSKYPIINSGSLDFPTESTNNGIFADIVVEEDTLRVINVHLQSYSIKPNLDRVEKEESKRVFLEMGRTFIAQQTQIELILDLIEDAPYKVILLGDFNNTAYSYIYRELRRTGLKDSFKEKGKGFGRTFAFRYFPLRIDFIMVDEAIEVTSYNRETVFYSDHFPIKTTINLK